MGNYFLNAPLSILQHLTGESRPDAKLIGETILAGMINLNTVSQVEVITSFTDSKLSKISEML